MILERVLKLRLLDSLVLPHETPKEPAESVVRNAEVSVDGELVWRQRQAKLHLACRAFVWLYNVDGVPSRAEGPLDRDLEPAL